MSSEGKIRQALNAKNERLLNDLKSLILFVKEHRSELNKEQYRNKFLNQQSSISKRFDALNDNDREWIEHEYQLWFEKEILPDVKDEMAKVRSIKSD